MQKSITFHKYHGTGNDFILIDSFHKDIKLSPEIIQQICNRRFGVGADGLIILRKADTFDFCMDFYNSDGKPGTMCGNGGRCIVAFAHYLGIISEKTTFLAPDGVHEAFYYNHEKISLKMSDVASFEQHKKGLFFDTGSPHLVILKTSKDTFNVYSEGKEIRYSSAYMPNGTNVNFLTTDKKIPEIFTYERGVENETFSCGTGAVAASLALNITNNIASPVTLKSKGGLLKISFTTHANNSFSDIWLEGPAINVFSGTYIIG
ncbi:MAG: diaminopimelate epimerase [Salinivirgaceae bacterium]|nr:diaminopimelate epimerase [Salinivirgaceae bacterium]